MLEETYEILKKLNYKELRVVYAFVKSYAGEESEIETIK